MWGKLAPPTAPQERLRHGHGGPVGIVRHSLRGRFKARWGVLKATLLKAAASPRLRRQVTSNPVAWRVARRFIAGNRLDDAERVIHELNSRGVSVALDHLGENTESAAQARAASAAYLAALDRIQDEGLDANISVKLTALGLDVGADLVA